jgi:hypothetical protein
MRGIARIFSIAVLAAAALPAIASDETAVPNGELIAGFYDSVISGDMPALESHAAEIRRRDFSKDSIVSFATASNTGKSLLLGGLSLSILVGNVDATRRLFKLSGYEASFSHLVPAPTLIERKELLERLGGLGVGFEADRRGVDLSKLLEEGVPPGGEIASASMSLDIVLLALIAGTEYGDFLISSILGDAAVSAPPIGAQAKKAMLEAFMAAPKAGIERRIALDAGGYARAAAAAGQPGLGWFLFARRHPVSILAGWRGMLAGADFRSSACAAAEAAPLRTFIAGRSGYIPIEMKAYASACAGIGDDRSVGVGGGVGFSFGWLQVLRVAYRYYPVRERGPTSLLEIGLCALRAPLGRAFIEAGAGTFLDLDDMGAESAGNLSFDASVGVRL